MVGLLFSSSCKGVGYAIFNNPCVRRGVVIVFYTREYEVRLTLFKKKNVFSEIELFSYFNR